jgi:hypothetical protein
LLLAGSAAIFLRRSSSSGEAFSGAGMACSTCWPPLASGSGWAVSVAGAAGCSPAGFAAVPSLGFSAGAASGAAALSSVAFSSLGLSAGAAVLPFAGFFSAGASAAGFSSGVA